VRFEILIQNLKVLFPAKNLGAPINFKGLVFLAMKQKEK